MNSTTMRRGLMLVGIASLSLATGVTGATAGGKGKQVGKLAGNQCAQEKKVLGHADFDAIYGKPSMPNCKAAKATSPAVGNASQACRAKRAQLGVEAFRAKYGTNRNHRNAFGRCVSRKAKPALGAESVAVVNSARACRTEQSDPAFSTGHDGKTFDEYYGTNGNDADSFGKCVSGKSKPANA